MSRRRRKKLTPDQLFSAMITWAIGMMLIALFIAFLGVALNSFHIVWIGCLAIAIWSGISFPIH
jgi:hypothetical protein